MNVQQRIGSDLSYCNCSLYGNVISNMSAQVSKDNPGWNGAGLLPLHNLMFQRLRLELGALRRGRLNVAKNLAAATVADLWNFFLSKSPEPRAECPCCGWTGPAFLATRKCPDAG